MTWLKGAHGNSDAATSGLGVGQALSLYRCMLTSRRIDDLERELVARGEAYFQVGAAGHEGAVALAPLLRTQDFLHCHYRDKALMLARGVPARDFFDSLLCNAASHSAGRQMSAHLSAPSLNILSVVGPVGNSALQAVGIAQQIQGRSGNPLVLCSMGDGSSQQGEVLEAIAEAVRSSLPVLFLVQDNRYAISTRTAGQTFFSLPQGEAESFYGLNVHRVDGRRMDECHSCFRTLVQELRRGGGPALCVMAVERLVDHSNADDETAYRSEAERRQVREEADPLLHARGWLLRNGVGAAEIESVDAAVDVEVRSAMDAALAAPGPQGSQHPPLRSPRLGRIAQDEGGDATADRTMAEALRETLRARLALDAKVTLYGQDIEDPKGDVFGVTRGLSRAFPGRVCNAPLSESTIVGTSIGRALAGGRPVAFLQFADFLPLAFNQIAAELATMDWRTQGGWQAPVILLVSCGAFRPGLGPFHAATFDSMLAHLPGIDVAVPSSAIDAADMLDAAFESERPTVLLYPKALLHLRSGKQEMPLPRHGLPIGAARLLREGGDLTLVGWGNTVGLCERVASALSAAGRTADVIDLRWLAPWDHDSVRRSVARTGRLLVVHEDNRTAGFGAEVIARVVESGQGDVLCRRVAREDAFVPCNFALQLETLPSFHRTLDVAAEMLSLDVHWDAPPDEKNGLCTVLAIGSSPADQNVEVVALHVVVGQHVVAGNMVASVEADKAIFDIAAPSAGRVQQVLLAVGDKVPVGTPLLTLALPHGQTTRQSLEQVYGAVRLTPRKSAALLPGLALASRAEAGRVHSVRIRGLASVTGRGRLDNDALRHLIPTLDDGTGDGILRRTGVESRTLAIEEQNAVSMAVEAARSALHEAQVAPEELSMVICSTSTPTMIAPSTACQVMQRLAPHSDAAACDVLAACSGYLYALSQAWDFLQQQPQSNVLVLTTETMRSVVDIFDPQTSPLFGDAATATVLSAGNMPRPGLAMVKRPVLGGRCDHEGSLQVPLLGQGAHVKMDGKKVFTEAVRSMCDVLTRALALQQMALGELDLIVPHQANARIIEALRTRLNLPIGRVWNDLRRQGNTSSSSIPLALDSVLHRAPPQGQRIGLCAFGAGYTFGAAVLLPC